MRNDKFHYFIDFTDEEKAVAIKFVTEAIRGVIEMTIDQKAEYMFDKLQKATDGFYSDDEFEFRFTITTIGNDLIAAIGAARRKLKPIGE
jgi:hypothetical protein